MPAGLEGVDFARPPLRPDAALGADHPGRRGPAAHRRALGVPRRSAREPRPRGRDPADRGDDQPQHHRGVLRQPPSAAREFDWRGGQGLALHPRRDECRAHPGCPGMHR